MILDGPVAWPGYKVQGTRSNGALTDNMYGGAISKIRMRIICYMYFTQNSLSVLLFQ